VKFSGVESLAVKRRLYVCCSTVIFGVCNSVTVIIHMLKSVARKQVVENVLYKSICRSEL
jgi:hypothetical protein